MSDTPRLPHEGPSGWTLAIYRFLHAVDRNNRVSWGGDMLDTVVYRENCPIAWYFTNKDGHVLRKKRDKLSNPEILASYCSRKSMAGSEAVAMYVRLGETKSGDPCTTTEFFDADSLRNFLGARRDAKDCGEGLLVKCVEPKTTRQSMIRAIWTRQGFCTVSQRVNNNLMYDKRVDLQNRCETFEGTESMSAATPKLPQTLSDAVRKRCKSLVGHITKFIPGDQHIKSVIAYFKLDAHDRLWFCYCDSVRLEVKAPSSGGGLGGVSGLHAREPLPLPFPSFLVSKTWKKHQCVVTQANTDKGNLYDVTHRAVTICHQNGGLEEDMMAQQQRDGLGAADWKGGSARQSARQSQATLSPTASVSTLGGGSLTLGSLSRSGGNTLSRGSSVDPEQQAASMRVPGLLSKVYWQTEPTVLSKLLNRTTFLDKALPMSEDAALAYCDGALKAMEREARTDTVPEYSTRAGNAVDPLSAKICHSTGEAKPRLHSKSAAAARQASGAATERPFQPEPPAMGSLPRSTIRTFQRTVATMPHTLSAYHSQGLINNAVIDPSWHTHRVDTVRTKYNTALANGPVPPSTNSGGVTERGVFREHKYVIPAPSPRHVATHFSQTAPYYLSSEQQQ